MFHKVIIFFLTNFDNHITAGCFTYTLHCTHNEQYKNHAQHLPEIWWVQTQYQLEYNELKQTNPDAHKTGQVASTVQLAGADWLQSDAICHIKCCCSICYAVSDKWYNHKYSLYTISFFVSLQSLISYAITFWWNSTTQWHLWTMAGIKWKVSCMEMVSKFSILPLASEHPLSVLSLIVDMKKFQTNSKKHNMDTQHK